MSSYDVIVIGSGAGGGTLVHRLAPSGKRILLLERGDWLPREPQNWSAGDVFVDNRYISDGHLVRRRDGEGLPAAGALLRRRRHEALRRGALPAAGRGLRRASPSRRRLARLADRLRRDGALLHAGRAALPGARRPRRGPDRAPGQRALSVPGRVARAAHPAARRRSCRRRAPPVPRSLRSHAQRGRHGPRRLRPLLHLRRLPLPGAREVRRGGARRAAGARASERHAAEERPGRGAPHQPGGHRRDRGRRRSRRQPGRPSARTSSSSPAGRPTRRSCCWPRQPSGIPTACPTGPTSSGATTPSTTARPCSPCPRRRTRRSSRRRSASTTSTSARTTTSSRSATSRWSASRRRRHVPRREAARDQAGAHAHAREHCPPRGRLLALHRGPAAAREPRDAGPGRPDTAQLQADERRVRQAPLPQAAVAAGPPGDAASTTSSRATPTSRPTSRSRAVPTRRAPAASAPILRPPSSTRIAARTSSTTSTWSTRASSRASAR